jgi:hypothetical protein
MIKLLQIKVQNKTFSFSLNTLKFSDFTRALPSCQNVFWDLYFFLSPNSSLICKLTVAMCTYCCCTAVYTLLFYTFVQFVLYSRMLLALCTVLFAFSTSWFEWGPWENNANVLACSFLIISKNDRKQGILQIFDPSNINQATSFSLRLLEHTLWLEHLYSYLFQPLYTCTRTNLQVTYSGQIRGWSKSKI